MKMLLTLLLLSVCSIAFGQSPKDSTINLPLTEWHNYQFKTMDQEIKRLQATTIEAEIQRVYSKKDDILTSFLAGKVSFDQIIPGSLVITDGKVTFKVRVLQSSTVATTASTSTAKPK